MTWTKTSWTYDDQHKILQHSLELAVARDGNSTIDQRPHKRPDISGHSLCPSAKNLQVQCHTVHVGTIVRNDAERQKNQAELAEATKGRE